jgi:hypothetical protein
MCGDLTKAERGRARFHQQGLRRNKQLIARSFTFGARSVLQDACHQK